MYNKFGNHEITLIKRFTKFQCRKYVETSLSHFSWENCLFYLWDNTCLLVKNRKYHFKIFNFTNFFLKCLVWSFKSVLKLLLFPLGTSDENLGHKFVFENRTILSKLVSVILMQSLFETLYVYQMILLNDFINHQHFNMPNLNEYTRGDVW